jgi:AraC family transcriptional regulator of arabinose operon
MVQGYGIMLQCFAQTCLSQKSTSRDRRPHLSVRLVFSNLKAIFDGSRVADTMALHCVTKGKGVMVENGTPFEVSAGDVFVFWPGRHYRYFDTESAPWEYTYVIVDGDLSVLRAAGLPDGPKFAAGDNHAFWRAVEETTRIFDAEHCGFMTAVQRLWEILALLLEHGATPSNKPNFANDVRAFIARREAEVPNVAQIAYHFGIDRSTLFRRFNAATGMSVKAWIDRERFTRAEALLRHSDAPIREIARICGFRDALYFSRAFRLRKGAAPSVWRDAAETR